MLVAVDPNVPPVGNAVKVTFNSGKGGPEAVGPLVTGRDAVPPVGRARVVELDTWEGDDERDPDMGSAPDVFVWPGVTVAIGKLVEEGAVPVRPAAMVVVFERGKREDGLEAVGQAAPVEFEVGYKWSLVAGAVAVGPVGPLLAVALVKG